jgi:hypothetical protein
MLHAVGLAATQSNKVIAPTVPMWCNSGGLGLPLVAPVHSPFWIFDFGFRTGGHARPLSSQSKIANPKSKMP